MSRHVVRFAGGYAAYLATGRSPEAAFMSMRRLYCATNGRLNDSLAYVNRWFCPPRPVPKPVGVLGDLSRADIDRVVGQLDREGFHVFERRLSNEVCDGLLAFAETTPMQVTTEEGVKGPPVCYDPEQPRGVKYSCDQQTLMENEYAQRMVADPSILAVAQAYLRAEPVQDLVAMWWSTAVNGTASSAAAQLYHFDLDRIKFLKFFVYLTDVGPDNGPHCFIRRSHLRKPRALLRTDRISDEEILRHYRPDEVVEITGPRGTIAAVDTSGFHKGKPLVRGHRLMFQVEFAINLFGYNYPKVRLNDRFTPAFRAAVRARPRTFAAFTDGA